MAASPKACRIGPKTWKRNQKEIVMKIIVITGASSGFGALTARALAKAGHTVYAGMRDTTGRNARQVEEAKKFAKDNNVDLRTIELDVASQASVDAAIQKVVGENKRLDVVVHNAGHMVFGPAEAFTPEQLAELYDINVLSTQRVNRAALPKLRKQRNGLLVWVGSSSSAGGTPPYLAPYFAAKAAMDALAVVYARELTRWGIETSIIVPGAFTSGTNHFANAGSPADKERATEYEAGPYNGFADDIMKGFASIVPPDADVSAVAEAIVKVVDTPFGKRPFRVHVDPAQDGAEVVNMVLDRVRAEMLRRIGLADVLTPRALTSSLENAA
jgi:NAD(P)-dependent dehydrogenase (short-subunit alcohol dehydrogenase family)